MHTATFPTKEDPEKSVFLNNRLHSSNSAFGLLQQQKHYQGLKSGQKVFQKIVRHFFLVGRGWGSVLSLVLFEWYFISQTK